MKNNKRETVFILIGVVFLIFVFVSMGVFKDLGRKTAEEFYVNAKGQQWILPTEGTYEFTASSGNYPKFLSGKVDPVKVKVGDTQTMRIKVASPTPLKGVTAFIETDTKTVEVALMLVDNKALSGDYFESQLYLLNDKNELIINSAGSNYAKDALKQIVANAEAQSLAEYSFEGNWVVNDTHTKTYRTKFVAEAENGDKNEMILAWSDPVCVFSTSGVLQGSCEFGGGPQAPVEGFDGGNLTIPNADTVTVNGNATFVWNGNVDGRSRSLIVDGTIILSNGGQIKEAALYFDPDLDGDTWPSDTAFHYGNASTCDGCTNPIRVSASPAKPWNNPPQAGIDCVDENSGDPTVSARIHPQMSGSEIFYREPINGVSMPPGGNFDYDCSGDITGGWGDNVGEPISVSNTYNIVSGIGMTEACVVGTEVVSSTFSGSGYCGSLPPGAYSIQTCSGTNPGTNEGSPDVIPKNLSDGFMYNSCEACISNTLFGYCQ